MQRSDGAFRSCINRLESRTPEIIFSNSSCGVWDEPSASSRFSQSHARRKLINGPNASSSRDRQEKPVGFSLGLSLAVGGGVLRGGPHATDRLALFPLHGLQQLHCHWRSESAPESASRDGALHLPQELGV